MSSSGPILVVNLGWEQRRLVEVALDSGHDVVGVHGGSDPPTDLPLKRVERIDPRDLTRVVEFAREVRPVAVVADQCDYSHFAMAMVAATLGLPGPGLREAQLGCNKWLSRRVATAAGVRVPGWELCTDEREAAAAADRLGYPVILKPVDNRGSFGVGLVDRTAALPDAFREAVAHAHSRLVLVEQFVAGTSVLVEGYCFAGGHRTLCVGSKSHLPERPYVHMDILFPADLPEDVTARIAANNDRVVEALGFRFGMTSGEYILDAAGDVWLVEIANRGAGVRISPVIVPWVSGIDTTRQLVQDALGVGRSVEEGPRGCAYLHYLVMKPGVLTSVEGFDAALRAPGVLDGRYWGPTSGRIEWPRNALGRQGYLTAGGATRAEALSNAAAARERLRVTYA